MRIQSIILAAGMTLTAMPGSASAEAGDHGHGHHYGYAVAGAVYGGHARHNSRHHSYSARNHHDSYSSHSSYSRDCHKVSKHSYYHGREARIGGTQCYDRYGDPYIVSGSRYVIDYY